RPGKLEDVAPRRRLLLDDARHQSDAVDLADHSVLGNPDAAADLGGGDPLLPELGQLRDALPRPGVDPGRLADLNLDCRWREFPDRVRRPASVHPLPPVYSGWIGRHHKMCSTLVAPGQTLSTCCGDSGGTRHSDT